MWSRNSPIRSAGWGRWKRSRVRKMDRLTLTQEAVKRLLESGEVGGVLALRASGPSSVLHLYRPGDDLADLVLWPKYNAPKIMELLQRASPDAQLGMVVRGCEERGLIELAKH